MHTLLHRAFVALFILISSTLTAQQNDFVGVWQLTDEKGDVFHLHIHKDHSAESTYNKGENAYVLEMGFWRMSGDELHVMFNNGWLDVIKKSSNGYTKTAYKPGVKISKKNGNSSVAVKLDMKSIWKESSESDFVGYWELKDEKGEVFYLHTGADHSAQSTYSDGKYGVFGESGTWRFENNRIVITYNSGWVDIITKSGNNYKKVAYRPGQRTFTKPDNFSDAEKVDNAAVKVK